MTNKENGEGGRLHSFAPICDERSRVLILGTMASPASLRSGMFYGHPQNAFWRILSDLTGEPKPERNDEKRGLLLRHGVALWDTLASCEREGAADSAIKMAEPSDIRGLIETHPGIGRVFLNGTVAYAFYKKFHAPQIALPFDYLPSTSPANARGGYAAKLEAWRVISPFLV